LRLVRELRLFGYRTCWRGRLRTVYSLFNALRHYPRTQRAQAKSDAAMRLDRLPVTASQLQLRLGSWGGALRTTTANDNEPVAKGDEDCGPQDHVPHTPPSTGG
jgi:hypothetical protein